MALIKCKECGNEISSKATSCPKCGAPVKAKKSLGCGCGSLLLLLLILFIGLSIAMSNMHNGVSDQTQDTFRPQPAPSIPLKAVQVTNAAKTYTRDDSAIVSNNSASNVGDVHEITGPEGKYLSVALGQLATMHEQSVSVAKVMASIQTGDSTLNDIRKAIKLEKEVEITNYLQYYQTVAVPVSFTDIDVSIQKCYKLRRDAQEELLEYWNDSNDAHVASGMATYQRSVELNNKCIDAVNQKMKTLKKPSSH